MIENEKDTSLLSYDCLNNIVDTIDAIIFIVDLNTNEVLYSNQKAREELKSIDNKIFQKKSSSKWEYTNNTSKKTYLFSDEVIKLEDEKSVKIQIGLEITKEKNLKKKFLEEKNKTLASFEALVNATIEGLLVFDKNKICIKTNDVILSLLGYKKEEILGKHALDFIAEVSKTKVKKVITNKNQNPYEAYMQRKDGSTFPAILRGKDLILNSQSVRVSAVMDITTIKEKENQVSKLAYYDSLTSLPNRTYFIKKMKKFIKRSKYHRNYGALMFLDLDHFKIINDTKGHIIGDKILIESAKRIVNSLREFDMVSRFGGDEFVILIDTQEKDENKAASNASIVASKILKELRKPIFFEDYEFRINASIGIVTFLNQEEKIENLMKHADTAMYHSKENGRGQYSFFDPKLQQNIERKATLTEKLRKAIVNKKIEVFYQELTNSKEDTVGIELLSRWSDEELGHISPMEFIPIAEKSGLILSLGKHTLKIAAKYLNQFKEDKQKKDWKISVNLSLVQFQRDDFIPTIEKIVKKYKIPKNRLKLEITESVLLKDIDNALKKISKLNKLGILISIDDFGTGYSSLSYLKKLPIDEIKIDKSFIQDILENKNDKTIVQAILSIGKKFGFEVVAEGVESKLIYNKLIKMNCNYFQGFYFGKPQNINALN